MQPASITTRTAAVEFETTGVTPAASVSHARVVWRRRIAKLSRWLHIYGSMFSLGLVLFFAITGITLNHQEWFADQQVTTTRLGAMNTAWLRTPTADGVDKLQVVEYLRASSGVRGALTDFRIDDQTCDVAFKGPGYTADALVDRATGKFEITEARMGFAAIINDLHKGRDTGAVWKAVVDVSAGLLVFISLTGLVLLYFTHKYRAAGLMLIAIGAAVSYLTYLAFVR